MKEQDVVEILEQGIWMYNNDEDNQEVIKDTRSFKQEMLLTNDKGLVILLKDGSKFAVTVKQM